VNGVTFEPCKQHGDADAICFDLHVPNRGNGCSCSVGYHSETNTYTFETECVPDSCEGNPLIDHIDMNGPCDVTPSGSVCVFDCAAGYKSSQAVLCDLGVFQIDSSVSCLDALEVTGTIENIIVEEDATISDVELSQLFSVSDDAGSNQIQIYVHEVSPADIVSASITSSDNTLRLSLLPDANGIVNVTIRGQVGNNVKDVTFQIHVTAKNDAPRVANPVAPVTILEDSNTYVLSLSDLFEDVENDPIVLTVTSMMTTLLDVVILNDDVLYVTPKPDQNGETDITIRATTSNDGVFTETSIHFTVTAQNDDITLNRTLASVVIYEDSEPLSIDLTHVFVDVDNSVTNINASVSSSSPQHLLHSVNVQAEILMLSVEENLHGDATIRLVAFSEDGSEIYHDVNIIVESVDDAPVVAHPVADQLIDEDSGDHEIDLSNVFMDLDSEIVISVSSNSAPAILLAVVESTTLTLKPQSNQHGECMITLHAQAGDKYVETVFQVVIVPTDDGPVVARGISPIEMFEDADSMLKPLSGSFVDADGDEVGYLVVKCERFSSLKKCNDDDTTTLSTSEVTETECRILCATTMLSQSGCCTFDGSNCVWSSSTETITSTTTNSNLAAVCSNTSPLWSKFATIEILGTNTLQVSPIQNKFGNDTVELIVSSDYAQTILTTVPISVLPVNDLIALNTTLSNLAVYEDAAPMTIRNIIVDVDNDLRSFTASSSNENLVSVSVIGDSDITMSFSENLSGQAVVTVQAESEDNSTITHEIVVIVLPVDDAPVVLNPILDQTMLEDAPPMSLSLLNVFQDIDSTIELIEVFGNSNPDILSASIQSNGKFLVMTPVQDRSGFSDITLRALSQTQSAFLTFRVIVTSVDDAPKIVNQVSNQVMVESGANLEIDLSNVFIDLEGDEITIVGAVSTPLNILDLSMSSSNNNILTLSPIKDANGVVVVVVTCVANSLQTSMEFEVDVVPIDTAPRTDETKMNLLMDAASEASSCDIDDVCTWTYENAADVMYDVDSSDMLLSVTCLDSTHVKSIEIDSDTNVMKMTYTTDDMPLNYTVICTITAQADEKMHSAEFTKQFLGNGVDSSSSSSSTILGLDNDQTVMASTALAILVLILLALFVYYRRRVKKREAAMDRVVKRAEAELISIASKAWLEDDLNMMDDTDIGLDSVTSIESMAERQNRLQSHIESLKQDNKRMKENVEVLSNRLTNQDSLHQGRLILDADIPAFPPSENLSDL